MNLLFLANGCQNKNDNENKEITYELEFFLAMKRIYGKAILGSDFITLQFRDVGGVKLDSYRVAINKPGSPVPIKLTSALKGNIAEK